MAKNLSESPFRMQRFKPTCTGHVDLEQSFRLFCVALWSLHTFSLLYTYHPFTLGGKKNISGKCVRGFPSVFWKVKKWHPENDCSNSEEQLSWFYTAHLSCYWCIKFTSPHSHKNAWECKCRSDPLIFFKVANITCSSSWVINLCLILLWRIYCWFQNSLLCLTRCEVAQWQQACWRRAVSFRRSHIWQVSF